jgi:DNA-binding PadR family transcriptional regulator
VPEPIVLILASLAHGEKHGYAIMEDILNFAGVHLGPGTLYGAITRMEQRGLIAAVESSDRRQPYRITPQGRRHLSDAVASMNRVASVVAERLKHA